MTCIVGIAHKGKVFIGADSAGVDASSWALHAREDRKVFINGEMVIGFTTSFRMGQLLNYALVPPALEPGTDIMRYMVTDFVNSVRDCFKSGGVATKDKESESGGCFLVGFKGKLFRIESSYQVAETFDGFDSVGCGADVAIGALHATPTLLPKERIIRALKIAEKCSAGVRGPFRVESI